MAALPSSTDDPAVHLLGSTQREAATRCPRIQLRERRGMDGERPGRAPAIRPRPGARAFVAAIGLISLVACGESRAVRGGGPPAGGGTRPDAQVGGADAAQGLDGAVGDSSTHPGQDAGECSPSCGTRVCGPDPICGSLCGTCTGANCDSNGQCVPPAASAPRILNLGVDNPDVAPGGSVTVTAVVTDPDGIDDLVGGVLVDPDTGASYGSLATSAAEGAYSLTLSWQRLNAVRSIQGDRGAQARVLRASFFDQAGHETQGELPIRLGPCSSGLLCGGQCVASNPSHCATCSSACRASEVCYNYGCQTPTLSVLTVTPPSISFGTSSVQLEVSYAGSAPPASVWEVRAEITDGPSGTASVLRGPRGTYAIQDRPTTGGDGRFFGTMTLEIDRNWVENVHLGSQTLRLTADWETSHLEQDATFAISECPGFGGQELACAPAYACEGLYADNHCGSCALVCGASRTITTHRGTEQVTTHCGNTLGCLFDATINQGSCNAMCTQNGTTCAYAVVVSGVGSVGCNATSGENGIGPLTCSCRG